MGGQAAAIAGAPLSLGDASPVRLPSLREDLELSPASRQPDGSPAWNIYDPVRHQFFRIGWPEFEILSRWHLADAEAIARRVSRETTLTLPPARVIAVQNFLSANQLLAQPAVRGRNGAGGGVLRLLMSNWLYRRFPLLEPDGFLGATLAWTRFFFSPLFWWLTLFAGSFGLYLAARQWDVFLATFPYLFSSSGLFAFSLAVVLVKFCHELAHAYTAKRYGVAVPVIGVALLILWPVFYTDTTDAWRLRERRQRLAIGGAGILVELAVAAHATLLWSFLPPGPVKSVVFILATSTWFTSLLVNLNPCMRYDGYYLLADLWDIPNLQPRAFALARWFLRRALLGSPEPCPERFAPRRLRWLGVYALLVWCYRVLVFTAIALLVYHFAFKALGIILFAAEITVFFVTPVLAELRIWWRLRRTIGFNFHLLASGLLLMGCIGALFYPWSASISVPAVYKSSVSTAIHAPHSGRLQRVLVARGTRVAKGEPLFVLSSPELDFLEGQAGRQVAQLQLDLARSAFSEERAERLQVIEQQLVTAMTSQAGYREQRNRLQIKAPCAGRIMELADSLVPGRWVNQNLELALLVDDRQPVVEGYVREGDFAQVTAGMAGRFYPDNVELPVLPVLLEALDRTHKPVLEEPYLASLYGGEIAVRRDGQGRLVTDEAMYRLRLRPGGGAAGQLDRVWRGTVRLEGPPRNLLSRSWRTVAMVLIRESEF